MSGKGSSPRPFSVDKKTFDDNWDKIFAKKKEQQPKPEQSAQNNSPSWLTNGKK